MAYVNIGLFEFSMFAIDYVQSSITEFDSESLP